MSKNLAYLCNIASECYNDVKLWSRYLNKIVKSDCINLSSQDINTILHSNEFSKIQKDYLLKAITIGSKENIEIMELGKKVTNFPLLESIYKIGEKRMNGTFKPSPFKPTVQRYIPTIGEVDWDIKDLPIEERIDIKSHIKVGFTNSEEDYQAVISYMYKKYPDLMDLNFPDGTSTGNISIQWNYSPHKRKAETVNNNPLAQDIGVGKADMYALVYYDDRTGEPIAFAGSYFKEHKNPYPDKEIEDKFIYDKNDGSVVFGHGYVLFIDPNYRRLGLAVDSWITEAKIYRDDLNIKYQYEIQNENSLKVTQSMFSNPEKCNIVAPGRLKNDGTRAGIRLLMDYTDQDLIDRWVGMEENMKDVYHPFDWSFLEREGITKEELIEPWKK